MQQTKTSLNRSVPFQSGSSIAVLLCMYVSCCHHAVVSCHCLLLFSSSFAVGGTFASRSWPLLVYLYLFIYSVKAGACVCIIIALWLYFFVQSNFNASNILRPWKLFYI